jgi:hypothetical protein
MTLSELSTDTPIQRSLTDAEFEQLENRLLIFYEDLDYESHRPGHPALEEADFRDFPPDIALHITGNLLNNEQRERVNEIINDEITRFNRDAEVRNRLPPNNEEREQQENERNLARGSLGGRRTTRRRTNRKRTTRRRTTRRRTTRRRTNRRRTTRRRTTRRSKRRT